MADTTIKLIEHKQLATLLPASTVAAIADKAQLLHQEQEVAYLINSAANTGEKSVIWNKPMTDALKAILDGQGYKVTRMPNSANEQWLVRCK